MLFSRVKETNPQDAPTIAPDAVSVSWADKVLADISRDAKTIQPEKIVQPDRPIQIERTVQPEVRPNRAPPAPLPAPPASSAVVPVPMVDTTFRAAAVGDIKPAAGQKPRSKWAGKIAFIFFFGLSSAVTAGLWKHYGAEARQIVAELQPLIAEWTPQFSLAAAPPAEPVATADQAAAMVDQTAPADQPASQDAATTAAATAPAAAATAPAAASLPQDSAEVILSMQRDLASLNQQIEQLKASIAELKAGQPPVPVAARSTEAKPAEVKPPAPVARPRVTAVQPPPPPRSVAPPPVRRPPPVQASAAPMQLSSPPPPPPAPPAQTTADDGGPVVRPPMSLRWNGAND